MNISHSNDFETCRQFFHAILLCHKLVLQNQIFVSNKVYIQISQPRQRKR